MTQHGGDAMFAGLGALEPFDGDASLVALMNGRGASNGHQPPLVSDSAASPATTSLSGLNSSTAAPSFSPPAPSWAPFQDAPPYEPFGPAASFGGFSAAPFAFSQPWGNSQPQYVGQLPRLPSEISPTSLDGEPLGNPASLGKAQALSILTPAQQDKLRRIAMPGHAQYRSPKSEPSPRSSASDARKDSPSSPDAATGFKMAASRKRKSSADDEGDDEDDNDAQMPIKKSSAHNMIEKRYRTNLNDKIAALRDSVPSLRIMTKSVRGEDTTEDREELHGLTPAHKLNKATVLSKATEYIRHLEKRNSHLMDENHNMQNRINAFEKLFMHSAMNGTISPAQQPPTPMQYPQDASSFMSSPLSTPGGQDPPGMIQVPDDMKRIIQAQAASNRPYPVPQQSFQGNAALIRQQQMQQQQQRPQAQHNRWHNAGPYFGKLMVGSLAGLMILEAARESEQDTSEPGGRGLFAVPLQLLGSLAPSPHLSLAGYHFPASQVISTLKLLVLLGTLLWAFVPSMFASEPPGPHKSRQANRSLSAVPSLASPIHVRRQAWLTAIQTVWVPRHNVFLEAAALALKMIKMGARNMIGIHGYQVLTGLTEEQETARVKAWTIALDAQLAGGDVEINGSRIFLTLLASYTLPDTPLRLMLKALHVRVLVRQCGANRGLNTIARDRAAAIWNRAKQLNGVAALHGTDSPQRSDEELPEHLALLLEQECEDVLNDDIVQRAHNLAWNRPSAHGVAGAMDGMNAVVEDPAVRSPMDAVAAWWSSLVLERTLTTYLSEEEDDEAARLIRNGLDLAAKAAPVGSNAQGRALAARAVLVDAKRGLSISAALRAIEPTLNPDKHPQYSGGVPPLIDAPLSPIAPDPDVMMSLRCAMAMAHLQHYDVPPEKALLFVDSVVPCETEGASLLGCTSAFRLMECLHRHPAAADVCASSLERLAGTLRLWIGGPAGDSCGLDQDVRHAMVARCLAITKNVVGMDSDPGYVSMSDGDGDGDGEFR